MSRWANKINAFERADKRYRHLEGWEPQHSAAIKFLKTNPTKHQLLAYMKKVVNQAANDKYWMNKDVYEEFQDAVSILQDSVKELGISRAFERAFGSVEWALENNDPKLLKGAARKFYTQYKKEMAKPNKNFVKVSYNVSRAAEKWKIGKTKVVKGKRVKRTETELKKLIEDKKKTCEDRHGKWHFYCNKK